MNRKIIYIFFIAFILFSNSVLGLTRTDGTEFKPLKIILPFAFVSMGFGIMIMFARVERRNIFRRFIHREKALDFIIITKNKNLVKGVVPITNDNRFTFNKNDYLISDEAIYTQKFRIGQRPYSLYLEGVPKPIKFNFADSKIDFTGEDLKEFAESKLVKQLLETSTEKLLPLALILIGVAIILILVVGYMNYQSGLALDIKIEAIGNLLTRR